MGGIVNWEEKQYIYIYRRRGGRGETYLKRCTYFVIMMVIFFGCFFSEKEKGGVWGMVGAGKEWREVGVKKSTVEKSNLTLVLH